MRQLLSTLLLASSLAGCQTTAERVADNARLTCFAAGYGETSPNHAECMRTVQPVGLAAERRRKLREIEEGAALVGAGLRHNAVTCIQTGSVVSCHE